MKSKKVLSFVLVLAMLFTMMVPSYAVGSIAVTATSDKATVVSGDTFTITVKVSEATNVFAMQVQLKYDNTKLEFVKCAPGEFGNKFTSQKAVTDEDTYVDGSFACNDDALNNAAENVLYTATFRVKAGATGNIAPILVADDIYDGDYNPFTVTAAQPIVSILVPVTGVTLNPSTLSLDLTNNKIGTLTATVSPENATDTTVTWTSSNTSVATVDGGVVTAVAAGTATITATTSNDKTATCTVTVVNCLHTQKQLVNEKASTCIEKGWDAYYTCDCGVKLKADGTTVITAVPERELVAHNFAKEDVNAEGALKTAGDCTKPAVYYKSCTVCGNVSTNDTDTFESAYGTHNLTKTEAKAATCTADGNNEYWTCSTCGKVFKTDKTTVTTVADENIPAGHEYEFVPQVLATCKDTGMNGHYTCKNCDAVFTTEKNSTTLDDLKLPVDGNNHVGTRALNYDANQHWWHCSGCDNDIDKANHSGGTATCTEQAKCTTCSQPYGALKAHTLTKTEAKAATCTVAGNNEYWTCGTCNKVFSDAEGNTGIDSVPTIPALGHDMTKTEAVAPTCTEAGTLAYWTCSNPCCAGIKFGDEDGKTKLTSTVDPALGHDYGTLIAEVPSTCTTKGTAAHYYCEACDTFFDANKVVTTEDKLELPLADHTFDKYVPVVVGTETTIGVDKCVCSVCDALGEYTAYLKLPATLHIVKGANSTSNPPVGVKFAFVVGSGDRTFPATTGAATEDLVNEQSIGVGGTTQDEAICNLINTLTTTEEWTVKQTTASGDGWTVDATEYTVTFVVNENDNTVSVNITAPVTVTVTETNEDGSEKTYTKTEVQEFEKIEFTNTYENTSTRPTTRPSGGSNATSSDKVKSSKTFDAGIAAYVGLSVLSLTGSALVIGKKKEF